VTESQKRLRLFPFTLTGKARDRLLTIPGGTIRTWDELELKFLEKYFPMPKYWDKKMEIQNFKQRESESLYDAWERFTLMLKRCPNHELSEKQYLQIFDEGLTHDVIFLHVIYLTIRKYNRIISTGSCVYLKHLNTIYHIKCLGINCLFV